MKKLYLALFSFTFFSFAKYLISTTCGIFIRLYGDFFLLIASFKMLVGKTTAFAKRNGIFLNHIQSSKWSIAEPPTKFKITFLLKIRENNIAEMIINAGANLNLQYKDGNTALNLAIEKGNKNIAEMLIKKGANLNLQENDGFSALMIALDKGNNKIAEMIINAGANLNL